MSKEYLTHWLLGVVCTAVWFWGDRAGIPNQAITLSASLVPGLLAHALAISSQDVPADKPAS